MKYNGVIQRKLALLDSQLVNLRSHTRDISYEEFKDSWILRSMSERALQVCTEILIDIAERILALEKAGPAATAAEAMEKLATLGIIQSSEPYRSMVGLRNLIVHQYEIIDPEILYTLLNTKLDDFTRFRDELDTLK